MRFLLIFLLILDFDVCFSQWTQTNGPYGNVSVQDIVQSDSLFISSTGCGIFSKKQVNNFWELKALTNFSCHVILGDSLFIGGIHGFQAINLHDSSCAVIDLNSLTLNSLDQSNSTLYGSSLIYGVQKSTDRGISWNSFNTGLPTDTVNHGQNFYTYDHKVPTVKVCNSNIYCGTTKGIYKNSLNLGQWVEMNNGLPHALVTIIESYNDTLYIVINESLYESYDQANSWSLIYQAPSPITSILKVNNILYTCTNNDGIFYTNNDGSNWNPINSGLSDLNVTRISHHETLLICGTASKGTFWLNNNQWVNNLDGMICSGIVGMITTDSNIIATGSSNVFISSPNDNWTNISPNLQLNDFPFHVKSMKDTIFLSIEGHSSTWPWNTSYILFSPDNGATWSNLNSPIPFGANNGAYKIYCENGRLYVYEYGQMYFTDNLGTTWSNISLPTQFGNSFTDFTIYQSTLFSGGSNYNKLLKFDNVNGWTLSNNGIPNNLVAHKLAFCNGGLFAYMGISQMYASTDNGNSWYHAHTGLPNYQLNIYDFEMFNSTLFLATSDGVFCTSDFGQSWQTINTGLMDLVTTAIKIKNDTLYVGSSTNGIWKLSVAEASASILTQTQVQTKETLNIFPNPASEYVNISISNRSSCTLNIYDLLGNKIATKRIEANTNYCGLDVSEMKSGIYFICILNNGSKTTQKLMIVK